MLFVAFSVTTDTAPPAVPLGLGWADRLAGVALAKATTPRDAFTRRIFVGSAGAATAAFGVGAVMQRLILHAPSWPLALGALTSMVCLAGFASTGRGFFALVNVWLMVCGGISVCAALQTGGISGAVSMIWPLISVIMSTLLLGRRAGVFWLAVEGVWLTVYASWPTPLASAADSHTDLIGAFATLFMFGAVVTLALTWFVQERDLAEAQTERERRRADDLLLNVLPAPVVQRLKRGEVVADSLDEVSVLFADLVGFTPLAASMSAPKLVQVLDDLFKELDGLVGKAGLEKIKTIGDCYMVASGAPDARADHAQALVRLALEMAELVASRDFGGHPLRLRIGVHTGPVVAGVIGTKRQTYDLWGDTVNTASRLESSGVPGQVHVSQATRAKLDGAFEVSSRGTVELKGKGKVETFLVSPRAAS